MSVLLAILRKIGDLLSSLSRIENALSTQALAIQDLSAKLDQILNLLTFPKADHFIFSVTLEGQTTTGVTSTMLTDSQKETLSIAPADKKGFPATLDGVPVWASSDETIATVDASGDATGLTAVLSGVRPGSCTVTVTGDADLGSGVTPIVGTLSVSVTAGQATTINITEGPPTDQ